MISPPPAAHALCADADYARLKAYLVGQTGLAYYSDKDEQLAGHLARRMGALGLPDCAAYLRLLRDNEIDGPEQDQLMALLTIGETFFFRHHEAFAALRDVVFPDLIRRNQSIRKLRIWSAGCSIGAEPYSIAILLQRDLGHLLAGWEISIVATDINREFLARARAGRYEEWAFRSVPEEIRAGCFRKSGNGWVIEPQYRQAVSFQYHNLAKDPCPALRSHLDGFDLILCRNVTIYFDQETIRRLVQELHGSLPEGGWLLVGHAEPNVEIYRAFEAVNLPGVVLYQRKGEASPAPAWTQLPSFTPATQLRPPGAPAAPAPRPAPPPERKPIPEPPRVPLSEGTELASIRQMADHGDVEKAARCCEQLIEREKLNPVAHFYYALLLEQLGRRRETQESLRRAVYLDRNFIVAHYYLGLIQQRLADPKQAGRSFRNVLSLLSGLKAEERIPAAEELTVAELKQLAGMHLDALPSL